MQRKTYAIRLNCKVKYKHEIKLCYEHRAAEDLKQKLLIKETILKSMTQSYKYCYILMHWISHNFKWNICDSRNSSPREIDKKQDNYYIKCDDRPWVISQTLKSDSSTNMEEDLVVATKRNHTPFLNIFLSLKFFGKFVNACKIAILILTMAWWPVCFLIGPYPDRLRLYVH